MKLEKKRRKIPDLPTGFSFANPAHRKHFFLLKGGLGHAGADIIAFYWLYSLLLDPTIFKLLYSKKGNKKNVLNSVSHIGLKPTILRSRLYGESGHPWW